MAVRQMTHALRPGGGFTGANDRRALLLVLQATEGARIVSSVEWTLSIDAGGTFTDAIARSSDGRTAVAKVPSTPADPARGLADAVAAIVRGGVPVDAIGLLCHGTTVATKRSADRVSRPDRLGHDGGVP